MVGQAGKLIVRKDPPLKAFDRMIVRKFLLCTALMSTVVAETPKLQLIPNDPMLGDQWYLFSPDDRRGSSGSINAVEAWRHIRPAKPIVVALVDSGVNWTHPDLAANIWTNEREMLNGRDDDGNGYIDDLHGWDFADGDNNPIDHRSRKFPEQFDHGTALMSLMAAVPDNGIGTAGIGRNLKIMNLRLFGESELAGQSHAPLETTLPAAIRYAIRKGARVIVYAISALHPPEKYFGTSLQEAEDAGVLLVVAAGNQGVNIDKSEEFGYSKVSAFFSRHPNILIVGGSDRSGGPAHHMNFGERVGIAAPCVDIVVPSWDGYERLKGPGTSFAAPIVGAVAATLVSQHPDLTPVQVIKRLRDTSNFNPALSSLIGGGRLDMARLLRQ